MLKTILKTVLLLMFFIAINSCNKETKRIEGYSIHGLDISHYQGKIVWDSLPKNKINFIFVKATEGEEMIDENFSEYWKKINSLGIKRGAYHFFHATLSAEIQAQNFIDKVDLQEGDLIPVLDVEVQKTHKDSLISKIHIWASIIENHYNVKPIIYTNQKFYNEFLSGEIDDYPLWIARYSKDSPSLNTSQKWAFWQYGKYGKIKGIPEFVDFNVFYGNQENLKSFEMPKIEKIAL